MDDAGINNQQSGMNQMYRLADKTHTHTHTEQTSR